MKFAKLISAISSPFIVLSVFGLWVIAFYSSSSRDFLIFGSSFVILTVLAPFLYVLAGVKSGKLSDLHIAVREQRDKPFLVAIFGTLLLILAYSLERAPTQLLDLAIIMLINGIVFYFITRYWKISIHAAAFLGSVIIVGILIDKSWLYLSLLLPLIIWARIKRQKHDVGQALLAALVVALVILAVAYLMSLI